jgi:hypothetical protein
MAKSKKKLDAETLLANFIAENEAVSEPTDTMTKIKEFIAARKIDPDATLSKEDMFDILEHLSKDNGKQNMVGKWLEQCVLNRVLIIDETSQLEHSTVDFIAKTYKNVDKKRDYDFQAVNQYEKDCIDYFGKHQYDHWMVEHVPHKKFLDALKNGTDVTVYSGVKCYDCNDTIDYVINRNVVKIVGHNGNCKSNKFHKFRVRFPSGRVVADDSLAHITRELNESKVLERINLNDGLSAEVKYNDLAASRNISYIFLGNTCPTLYINKDKTSLQAGKLKNQKGLTKCGSICTDLWWSTVMDEGEYLKHLRDKGISEEEIKEIFEFWTFNSFEITPGTYEFTSRYSSMPEDDFDGVYWTAERVGD